MAACGSTEYLDENICETRVDLRFVNRLAKHTLLDERSLLKEGMGEVTLIGEHIRTRQEVEEKTKELRFSLTPQVEEKANNSLSDISSPLDSTGCSSMSYWDRNPTTRFPTNSLTKLSELQFNLDCRTPSVEVLSLRDHPSLDVLSIHDDGNEKLLVELDPEVLVVQDDGLGVKRQDTLVLTAKGEVITKKLATQEELHGAILAHVYFTTARSGKWPPFIISVPKDYNFMKMMRKAISGMQKTIHKGERPCHDWIFKYHVNKQIPKMRKELKVLFGRKKVEFRGTNLNKGLERANLDPLVNRFWILPKKK